MMESKPCASLSPPDAEHYDGYCDWKGWDADSLFTVSAEQAGYLSGELGDCEIAGKKVLEIGFGSGSCMAWMQQHGAKLFGCELNETLLVAAAEFGVTVIPANLDGIAGEHADQFETIVAFDVFEHFSMDQVRAYLAACGIMLKKGGRLLLRFPNAQSPFGLRPQMGDPTHRSALSRSVIEFLIVGQGLTVVRYGPSFRFRGRSWAIRIARTTRFTIQRMITSICNFAYATDIPYEPVVVIVLTKD